MQLALEALETQRVDQRRELIEPGLGGERARIVVLAQHPEQPSQVGERLASRLLDLQDRVAGALGLARHAVAARRPPG